MRFLTLSSFLFLAFILLGGCATVPGKQVEDQVAPLMAQQEFGDHELLNVSIKVFDPGELPEKIDKRAGLSPEIREAEGILDHIESVAEEQDYEVETALLQAREAGLTIVDEAAEQGVDLILMGVKYKMHFGQFSLGSAVPYVLKNAPCRVILYHQTAT